MPNASHLQQSVRNWQVLYRSVSVTQTLNAAVHHSWNTTVTALAAMAARNGITIVADSFAVRIDHRNDARASGDN
jgi:hypothetical protein